MKFKLFLKKKTTTLFPFVRSIEQFIKAFREVLLRMFFVLNIVDVFPAKVNRTKKVYWNNLLVILSIFFSTGFIFSDKEAVKSTAEESFMFSNENIEGESVAPVIIKVCYNSHDFGISGRWKTYADDKLRNLNNWGPSGTDSRYQFELFSFGTSNITEAALIANGCQIFYAGGTNTDAGSFSASTQSAWTNAEKEALKNWAMAADKVLIAFQGIAVYAGGPEYAGSNSNRNPNMLTPLGENVISGAFGQSNSFNQSGGFQGSFTSFPSTACVLTEDANGNPTGLINSLTGDFYLADYGITTEAGGLTNNNGISSNTDMLFANLFSSAAMIVEGAPTNACNLFHCPAGDTAPVLSSGNVSSSGTAVDLPALFTGTPPAGASLTWHSADPVDDSNYIGNSAAFFEQGTVYATFRAHDGSCYSPASPVNVTIDFPDLVVSTTPLTSSSFEGETQTYTVTVTNNGTVSAPEALVKVPIPNERSLVLANPSTGSYNGSSALWNVGELTTGQSATLEITLRIQ